MNHREVIKQALRALEDYKKHTAGVMIPQTRVQGDEAIAALYASLEQPEQAPVAWIEHGLVEAPDGLVWERGSFGHYTPLYTHPPHRKPLTPEEILALFGSYNVYGTKWIVFARAVERAHGIGGEE